MYRVILCVSLLAACNDSGPSGSTPTTTTTSIPTLQISGSVTAYRFDALSSTTGRISYIVTTTSSRSVAGCFVEVKWLDASGLQVGFTFAATDVSIPAGTSTITNQDLVTVGEAQRITNSRVEYSLCR